MMHCRDFAFVIVTILLLSANGDEQVKTKDNICNVTIEILCVKDILNEIATAAKEIHKIANEIEHNIYEGDLNKETLANYIHYKTNMINATFPPSKIHNQFFEMNNIDKFDLIRLLKEEYNAVAYLYNSIKNLRHAKSTSKANYDDLFDMIQMTLQKIICDYRSVLRVYGEPWLTIDEISSIQIGGIQKRQITSMVYKTYSMMTVRLIRQWMDSIDSIINNLENKLF